jgi:hypothetical protein
MSKETNYYIEKYPFMELKFNVVERVSAGRLWASGPWDGEPDFAEWKDRESSYLCQIRRMRDYGHLCGYVAFPKRWVIYMDYINKLSSEGEYVGPQIPPDIRVHGGVTFRDKFDDSDNHWLGFDCAHCNDIKPGAPFFGSALMNIFDGDEIYRTFDYAYDQCTSLAHQLHEYEKFINKMKESNNAFV